MQRYIRIIHTRYFVFKIFLLKLFCLKWIINKQHNIVNYSIIPWKKRSAKCDRIVSTRTRKRTGCIVVSVAVRFGARGLKQLRVHGRLTRGRWPIIAVATVLRAPKRVACALARAAAVDFELGGAPTVEVRSAARGRARTGSPAPFNDHR